MTDLQKEQERYIRDRATVMSIVKYTLIICVAGVLIYFATRVVAILVPFLIGFLLAKTAHLLAGLMSKAGGKKKADSKKKRKTALVLYIVLLILMFIGAGFGIAALVGQATRAFEAVQAYASNITDEDRLTELLLSVSESRGGFISDAHIEDLRAYANEFMAQLAAKAPGIASTAASSIWSFIGNLPYAVFALISVILSGYYFLADGPKVLMMYMKSVPNKSFRRSSISLIDDLSVTLFRALGGYLVLLLITMAEAWITFILAGVEYALVIALITAVLDFLPVLGIWTTMVPVVIYCISCDNYRGAVIIVIAMIIMSVIRRYIEPAVLGKTLKMHPLLVLISMALGVYIWGALGFLMGPVVYIIIHDVLKVFGIDKKVSKFLSDALGRFMTPAD